MSNSTKKILFIAPVPPPLTGQAIACKALYDSFIRQGHAVELVNLSKKSFVSGVDSYSRVLEIFKILKLVFKKKKDVDYVYFTPAESVAGNLKDLLIYLILFNKLPVTFIHLHGGAGMKVILSSKHPILKNINGFFIKRMKCVIVLGDRLSHIYKGLISESKIKIAKNFSLPDFFISPIELKNKYQKIDTIKILFLSNLLPGKGYKELLCALKALPVESLKNLQVDFAGGFEDEQAKEEFIKDISSYPQFHYHGVVAGEQKKRLLEDAHLFCLPTYYPYEGQPISILEAYASGCAVMTTDHSGIFDIFTPDRNGIQVKPADIDSITTALKSIVVDKDLLRKYAVLNAYEARRFFKVEKHLAVMNDIINISK